MEAGQLDDIRRELGVLNQAFRLLGCKWDHLKQRVVLLEDNLGNPDYPDDRLNPMSPAYVGGIDDASRAFHRKEYAGRSVFTIKIKGGRFIKLRPNPAQLHMLTAVFEDMALGIPVFIAILKARQIGFSTIIALLFLGLALVKDALNVIIAAHINDSASSLFGIIKTGYMFMPEVLKPIKEKDNVQELKFAQNQSQLKSFKAKEGSMGVSTSYTHAHFSELALWQENPPETLATALDAIPKMVGVIVFVESTSRGKNNILYDMWKRATAAWEEVENRGAIRADPWRPLFYSWMDDADYRLPVTEAFKLTQEEIDFQKEYRCTREQLAWRRAKINEKVSTLGYPAALAHFNRENPSDPDTAFKAAGSIVFDLEAIDWLNETFRQVPQITYDAFLSRDANYPNGYKPMILPNGLNGALRIYQQPQEGVDYDLWCDPTRNEGVNPNDAAFHIIDTRTIKQVAAFSLPIDPADLGRICAAVGWYYNYAFAVIENNNAGITTCRVMYKELGYTNMHHHVAPGKTGYQTSRVLGFSMKGDVRSDCIENFKRYICEYRVEIPDYLTLDEMESFRAVYDKKRGKFKEQAETGKQDNLVTSYMMGLYVGNQRYSWHLKEAKRKQDPRVIKGVLELPDGALTIDLVREPEPPRLEGLLSD